jgi:chromosomal replication initiation ATPase DnaA
VPSHTFETWVKDTALLRLEKSTAIIRVGSQLARQWLERRLYFGIVRALRDVVHQDVDVLFVTA